MERINSDKKQSGSLLDTGSLPLEDFSMDFEIMDITSDNGSPTLNEPFSPMRTGSDDQPPLRQRFGAEMTIIAATSPEIKALNLPITPTFPTGFEFNRSKSFSGFDLSPSSKTVLPGMIRTHSMKERVSFLIDQMDDVDAISSSACPPACHQSASDYHDGDRGKAPFRSLHMDNDLQNNHSPNQENIQPHLSSNTSMPNQQVPMFETPGENNKAIKKPPMYSRRKSLHRRDSTASLPSPAEIAASPISCESQTPRQKNVSFCSSTLPPSSQANSIPLAPKSLHMSSGFR